MTLDRRSFVAAMGAMSALGAVPAWAQSSKPIRIGGSLPLTGPLSAAGLVHKLVGEIYVESLNQRGGLLGRPVEWVLKDDQSKPELARTLYEQLVTSDKVDLLIGPYATGAILAAMGVAQRYGRMLVHHTFGIPSMAKYERQFPAWSLGPEPDKSLPALVLDALAEAKAEPKTIAILTSKFPSVHFVSKGARQVAKQRGIKEVLFLEWEFGNRDFGPIASRVKDANPDLIWGGVLGLEANQLLDAFKKIDYVPGNQFHYVPASSAILKAPESNRALSTTIFESHAPFTDNPAAADFVKIYRERAEKANLVDTSVETQAAASFSAWQIIERAVTATQGMDDEAMSQWLRANRVDTIQGSLRFDGPHNYGDDLSRIKQIQDGKWATVYPGDWAAPGATLQPR